MSKKKFLNSKALIPIIALFSASLLCFQWLSENKVLTAGKQLPWQITLDEKNRSHVFGLTLGKTSLADAEKILKNTSDISLFIGEDGKRTVEAFFPMVELDGIRAKIVLNVVHNEKRLQKIYDEGMRVTTNPSGGKVLSLSSHGLQMVMDGRVTGITYVPAAKLEKPVLIDHFSAPQRIISDKNGVEHWLYPDKGLAIVHAPDNKVAMQYVNPRDFAKIEAKLP